MDLIFDIGSNYNILPTNNFRKNCNLEKKEIAVSDLDIINKTRIRKNIFGKQKWKEKIRNNIKNNNSNI